MKKFSWKRATGLTNAKRKFNKASGISAINRTKKSMSRLGLRVPKRMRTIKSSGKEGCACCPCLILVMAFPVLLAIPLLIVLL